MDKFHVVLILLAVVLVAFFARLAYIDFFNPIHVLRELSVRVKKILYLRLHPVWRGEVYIAIYPKKSFLTEDLRVATRDMYKYFFGSDDNQVFRISYLGMLFGGEDFIHTPTNGESLCATKRHAVVKREGMEEGELSLIHEGHVVQIWHVLRKPRDPLMLKRAIVLTQGCDTNHAGTLCIRCGPNVTIRYKKLELADEKVPFVLEAFPILQDFEDSEEDQEVGALTNSQ